MNKNKDIIMWDFSKQVLIKQPDIVVEPEIDTNDGYNTKK